MTGGPLSLWGRVLDAGGNPLPDAKVYWVAAAHAGGKSVSFLHAHRIAHTDEAGAFFAQDLPPGPCVLVPDYRDMGVVGVTLRIDRGTRVTLPPPAAGEDLLLRFPVTPKSFGKVHGTVVDGAEQAPVRGLPVLLTAPDRGDDFQRMTATDDDGAYALPWLLPGQYVLGVPGTVRHLGGGAPFEVIAGRESKVGIRLQRRGPGATFSVEVRVEDPLGAPVEGARVDIQAPGLFVPPLPTGSDGMARAGGLPVRPAAAMVLAPGFRPMGIGWPPEDRDTEYGGTVSLQRLARCRVAVVDAGTGRPLRNANILLVHAGNDAWKWTGMAAQAADFQEFEVVPGEVALRVECPGYRMSESRETVLLDGPDEPIVVRLHRGGPAAPPA